MKSAKRSYFCLAFIFLVGAFVFPLEAKAHHKIKSHKSWHKSECGSCKTRKSSSKSSFSFNLALNSVSPSPVRQKIYVVEEPLYVSPFSYNKTVVKKYYSSSPRAESPVYFPASVEEYYYTSPQRIPSQDQYSVYKTYYTPAHTQSRYVSW